MQLLPAAQSTQRAPETTYATLPHIRWKLRFKLFVFVLHRRYRSPDTASGASLYATSLIWKALIDGFLNAESRNPFFYAARKSTYIVSGSVVPLNHKPDCLMKEKTFRCYMMPSIAELAHTSVNRSGA
jgi:hypothetical protein